MVPISSGVSGNCLLHSYVYSFIHSFKNFHSASSSSLLLRGSPDSSTVKTNSFKTIRLYNVLESVLDRRRNSRGRLFHTNGALTQKTRDCMREVQANGTERTPS